MRTSVRIRDARNKEKYKSCKLNSDQTTKINFANEYFTIEKRNERLSLIYFFDEKWNVCQRSFRLIEANPFVDE